MAKGQNYASVRSYGRANARIAFFRRAVPKIIGPKDASKVFWVDG